MADEALAGWQRLAVIGVVSGGAILAVAALSVSLVYGRVIDRLLSGFLMPMLGTLLLGFVLSTLGWLIERRIERKGGELPGPNPLLLFPVAFNIATFTGAGLIAGAWLVASVAGARLREPLLEALILLLVGSLAFVYLPLIALGSALQLFRLRWGRAPGGNGNEGKAI